MDSYLYQNSNTLKNKLNIKNQEELSECEFNITMAKFLNYQKSTHTDFSFKGLKKIHRYLFEDIFDWAGKERTVNIAKDNSMFCSSVHITSFATVIFQKLKKDDFLKSLSRAEFCTKLAELYSDLNALHPFREGNGRVQALFIYHLAKQAGYKLDIYLNIDQKELIEASKQGMFKDNKKLTEIIAKSIVPLDLSNKNC